MDLFHSFCRMELLCWCLLLLSCLQSLSAHNDFFTSIGKSIRQHMAATLSACWLSSWSHSELQRLFLKVDTVVMELWSARCFPDQVHIQLNPPSLALDHFLVRLFCLCVRFLAAALNELEPSSWLFGLTLKYGLTDWEYQPVSGSQFQTWMHPVMIFWCSPWFVFFRPDDRSVIHRERPRHLAEGLHQSWGEQTWACETVSLWRRTQTHA